MQKFRILLLTLLMALLIIPLAFASVGVKNDGTMLGAATDINFSTGLTATGDGSEKTVVGGPVAAFTSGTVAGVTITGSTIDSSIIGAASAAAGTFTSINADSVTLTTPLVGTVELPIQLFTLTGTGSAQAAVTATTTPGLELDNLLTNVSWADGEVTPVQVTLKVPEDYLSSGAFKLFCDSSDSTTPTQVDFDVYVNGHNTTWDATTTNQTPVALSTGAGTPCVVTLTPATDFASLAAGKVVTLRIWRDNVSDGTGDLETYYAEFYYNRK